ncbi:MAG TPA: inorganic phosphate transporter [Candidatus Hydrothermia bacterium]|nr:inorganic phosphate transporter [Candidatus Hydrothermia bacterium]HOL23316.1 inorganic phosphate transporter [Candidatus Hydrothermia bacterium]
MNFIFLLGGLVLGWALGANNTADIFGTAVGTKMVKLRTALVVASIFVILGAILQGSETTRSIGELGKINAIGGSFTVCLATGLTVIWMTRAGFLVSITQALVGGIVGWTIFSGDFLNVDSLGQILKAWVIAPFIAFILAFIIYKVFQSSINNMRANLFTIDYVYRLGFLLLGALGAFSFGANNIANIVGVYIFSNPLKNLSLFGVEISALHLLLFVGSLSIALGILTGSKKVIETVGSKILKLSSLAGLVVVLTETLVLLLFSSNTIRSLLRLMHLPALPLVPISSSQVVIGAMMGIGVARGAGRLVNFGVLKNIILAWIITPLAAGFLSLVMLYFAQNVFQVTVRYPIRYVLDNAAMEKLERAGIPITALHEFSGKVFPNGRTFKMEIQKKGHYRSKEINKIIEIARVDSIVVDSLKLNEIPKKWFTEGELKEFKKLHGRTYVHSWQFYEELLNNEAFMVDTSRLEEVQAFSKKMELLIFLFKHSYQ